MSNAQPFGADDETVDDGPRDRLFNPWRVPKSHKARKIVGEAVQLLLDYEARHQLRQRNRRPADQTVFETTVGAILCDLFHNHLSGSEGGIAISRSNQVLGRRSRYRPAVLGKKLPVVLNMMEAEGVDYVAQEIGHQAHFGRAKRTTLRAGKRVLALIEAHNITHDDLAVSDQEEVIVLRAPKEDYFDEAEEQEYRDTPETNRFRQQMNEINAWLDEADVDLDIEPSPGADRGPDRTNRRLRRIFTQGRFDRGGRLFGGFWQEMSKQQRRESIILDGETVAELDFGQMNPRIVYGLKGVQPTQGDLYAIPGYDQYRSGLKMVMNAMLFSNKPLTRMPKGVREKFAKTHRVEEVVSDIMSAHPAIRDQFFTGIGHRAQFIESELLMAVLLHLKAEGIYALPIHDAVMVPSSRVDETREIMLSTFRVHTGVDGEVSVIEGRG